MPNAMARASVEIHVPRGGGGPLGLRPTGTDYAKISSSVGTFLFVMTLPMRDTFMRCL
jgi:hypothetical protein